MQFVNLKIEREYFFSSFDFFFHSPVCDFIDLFEFEYSKGNAFLRHEAT